ncbi:hypothetical protein EMIT0P218_50319 [Pseudomonas sp. IT-P218]
MRKNSDWPQRQGQILLLRELSPMKGAAMRELSCSKKRYMSDLSLGLAKTRSLLGGDRSPALRGVNQKIAACGSSYRGTAAFARSL